MKMKAKIFLALILATFLLIIISNTVVTPAKPSNIVQAPNEKLITMSESVTSFGKNTRKIADDLLDAIRQVDSPFHIGLGMAAPQVGYNKRIIALKRAYHDYDLMINPQVIEQKWLLPSPSRCFSLSGIHIVPRYFWYKIKYQDINGNWYEETIRGSRAATLHQEIDHLNGILLTDYQ